MKSALRRPSPRVKEDSPTRIRSPWSSPVSFRMGTSTPVLFSRWYCNSTDASRAAGVGWLATTIVQTGCPL
ncbi:MAG: hypothetical protein NTX27_00670 [Verrucomicrobia bacterium]|nr:hypothetical protein [Verrucomicrobiota bacterium]